MTSNGDFFYNMDGKKIKLGNVEIRDKYGNVKDVINRCEYCGSKLIYSDGKGGYYCKEEGCIHFEPWINL